MSHESQLWRSDLVSHLRFRRVLEVVIYVYLPAHRLCRYYIVALRHLSRLVDFPRVIYRDINRKLFFLLIDLFDGFLCHGHLN